jgi:hypothetical protein
MIAVLISVALVLLGALYFRYRRGLRTSTQFKLHPKKNDSIDDSGDERERAVEETSSRERISRLQRKKRERDAQREARRQAAEHADGVEGAAPLPIDGEGMKPTGELRLEANNEEAAVAHLREERKRQQEEEYQRWKGLVDVEARGELGAQDDREQQLRTWLVTTACRDPRSKVLMLEEVARRYETGVEKIVALLEKMVEEGLFTGVVDDRGKFLFVSEDELNAVAKFISQRGRASLHEIVRECNRVVSV